MEDQKQYLDSLTEIRSIMERSSKFLSLSGLSGVAAGISAIICGVIAYWYLNFNWGFNSIIQVQNKNTILFYNDDIIFFLLLGTATIIVALASALFFTRKNAKKKGLAIWDKTAKLVTINMLIPLVTGGLFVLLLVFKFGIIGFVAPTTLIFYGLALVNVSKFTVAHTRYLGISEIILGLAAMVFYGYGLLFWIIGFGVFHIIYGIALYNKYEKK